MPSDKAMAPHSSTLAWKIPCAEEPAGLQSMGSLRAGHDWLSDFTFTFHFHALEKEMATHSSVLAWRIPGTGESGGLPSLGSHRVRHDWSDLAAAAAAANAGGFNPLVMKIPWRRKWKPTPVFLSGKSHGQRSLVGHSPQGRKELDTAKWLNNKQKRLNNNVFNTIQDLVLTNWSWTFGFFTVKQTVEMTVLMTCWHLKFKKLIPT